MPIATQDYIAKLDLEPKLAGFRLHTINLHTTQPLKSKVTNAGVFAKQKEQRKHGENEGRSQFLTVPVKTSHDLLAGYPHHASPIQPTIFPATDMGTAPACPLVAIQLSSEGYCVCEYPIRYRT